MVNYQKGATIYKRFESWNEIKTLLKIIITFKFHMNKLLDKF